ncbi:hypothetical protein [Clostridium tertium]|uniref:hypothetical protein n=1 Tax=Clostridium tertium TaxID=1559 RepID=UPI0015D51546|nr:hypothetical protein [Clostridium tertium]
MDGFLYIAGSILIIASFSCAAFSGSYAVIVFFIIFGLGCIVLGIGEIISLLKDKQK